LDYLSGLNFNHDFPHLSLLGGKDVRHEQLTSGS
jgi:hypothetical protein